METTIARHRAGIKFIVSRWFVAGAMILIIASGCSQGKTDAEHVQWARELLDKGDSQAALIELKNALTKNSENVEGRWLLGGIYLEFNDGELAEKELRRAQELGLVRETVVVPLVEALLMQGKTDEALDATADLNGLPLEKQAELKVLRGQAYLGQNQMAEAKGEFDSAMAVAPDFPVAWYGQALVAYVEKRWDKALEWNDRVLEARPDFPRALALKGDIVLARGELEQARDAYRQAVEVRPHTPEYRLGLAIAQIRLGELKDAVANLDQVLRVIPNEPRGNYYRGFAAFQQGDYEQAKQRTEQALEQEPSNLASRMIAGASNYALKEYEAAYQHLQQFLQIAPGYAPVQKLLAATQLQLGQVEQAAQSARDVQPENKQDAELFAAIGEAVLRQGNLKLSREYLEKAVLQQPDQANLRTRLGLLQSATGEEGKGIEELKRAAELLPDSIPPQVILAGAYLKAGAFAEALAVAERLQVNHPEDANGYTLAGVAHAATGADEKARAMLRKALELRPGDPNAAFNLAAYARKDKRPDEERRLYREVLKHNPEHLGARVQLSLLESRQGNHKLALELMNQALEQHPSALQPRLLLGQAYINSGKVKQALEVLKPALERYPDNASLQQLVGVARLKSGAPEAAASAFEVVLRSKPDQLEPNYNLALAYEQLKQYPRALERIEQALRIDPTHGPSRFLRGRLLAQTGQLAAARQALQQLAISYPDSPQLLELEGRIAMAQKRPAEAVALFQRLLKDKQTNFITIQLAAAQIQAGDTEAGYGTLRSWLERYPEDLLTRATLADLLLGTRQLRQAQAQYQEILRRSPDRAGATTTWPGCWRFRGIWTRPKGMRSGPANWPRAAPR